MSWSEKTKRNALQLLSGLNIVNQIKKDVGPTKPVVDDETLLGVKRALADGMRNDWDDYDKKDYNRRKDTVLPWYDDGTTAAKGDKIETFRDAYFVLAKVINPLKKVPSQTISRAFRKLYITQDVEKLSFLKQRGLVSLISETSASRMAKSKSQSSASNFAAVGSGFGDGAKATESDGGNNGSAQKKYEQAEAAQQAFRSAISGFNSQLESTLNIQSKSGPVLTSDISDYYFKALNGTWEVVVALSDKSPYTAKRYEYGDLRRTLITQVTGFGTPMCEEVYPTFWGLSQGKNRFTLDWDGRRNEVSFSGGELSSSQGPWVRRNDRSQSVQVTFCDDTMLVTKQMSESISEPDLYLLWKRVLPTVWKKY